MYAIWSRAVPTRGACRCIQCVANTSAVAGRHGANSIRGPWAFGTPTSTFVYTSIFVAGMAIDAKAKQRRNEQWEAVFAHLREDEAPAENTAVARNPAATWKPGPVGRLAMRHHIFEEASLPSAHVVPLEDIWPDGVDWDFIHRTVGMHLIEDPVLLERQSVAQMEGEDLPERLWDLMPFDSSFPGTQQVEWPVNTGPALVRRNLPPQSLWSLDSLREKALRKRHTWKKIAVQELSMGYLVHRILHLARAWELPAKERNELAQPTRDIASLHKVPMLQILHKIAARLNEMERLPAQLSADDILKAEVHDIPTRIPKYHQDADGDFLYTCKTLNAALLQLLSNTGEPTHPTTITLRLAKVCHNLAISSAPPDVQTFNILITGLKRWKMHAMTDAVIKTMLKAKIRPNEITCATILDHYIQTNRPKEFCEFVGRMRGTYGALMLARPDVQINEASQGRLVRAGENNVYQKVFASPLVHNVLIHGALRFAGFDRAMEIYYEMKEDGWGLDVPGLSQLLADCVFRADWDGGLYVWKEISKIKERAQKSDISRAYTTFLSLASVTGQGRAFKQIIGEVEQRGLNGRKILESALKTTEKINKRQANRPRIYGGDHIMMALLNYREGSVAPRTPSFRRVETLPPADPNEEVVISESRGALPPNNPWPGIDSLVAKEVEAMIQNDNQPNPTHEAASRLERGFEESILGDATPPHNAKIGLSNTIKETNPQNVMTERG